jgi:hypothetical protein
MRPNDLLTWLRAVPFVPFRIRLNSDRTFDIRHPEMLRVGRSSVNVYSFSDEPADPYKHMEMVSNPLSHWKRHIRPDPFRQFGRGLARITRPLSGLLPPLQR